MFLCMEKFIFFSCVTNKSLLTKISKVLLVVLVLLCLRIKWLIFFVAIFVLLLTWLCYCSQFCHVKNTFLLLNVKKGTLFFACSFLQSWKTWKYQSEIVKESNCSQNECIYLYPFVFLSVYLVEVMWGDGFHPFSRSASSTWWWLAAIGWEVQVHFICIHR